MASLYRTFLEDAKKFPSAKILWEKVWYLVLGLDIIPFYDLSDRNNYDEKNDGWMDGWECGLIY